MTRSPVVADRNLIGAIDAILIAARDGYSGSLCLSVDDDEAAAADGGGCGGGLGADKLGPSSNHLNWRTSANCSIGVGAGVGVRGYSCDGPTLDAGAAGCWLCRAKSSPVGPVGILRLRSR